MLSSSQKKEMKLAVMLMIVVLVFLICNVLSLVVNILEVFEISYKPLTEISNLGRRTNSIFCDNFQCLTILSRDILRDPASWPASDARNLVFGV